MIYEYALEPELVATWTNRKDYRYFMPSFGLGQGRIVSRYPKRWKRLVWNAPRANDDFSRKRLEALLDKMSETMVRRSDIHWDADSTSWMENSEGEHERRPFHAILARENPRNHTHVLTELDIDEPSTSRWAVEPTRSVQRTAARMAGLVAPLLRSSSVVLFIDPYFRPDKLRYRNSFTAFMERMVHDRPGALPKRIEVLSGVNGGVAADFFRQESARRLPRCVPAGIRVVLRRLVEKPNGEKLHNRYILTDMGGITFGTGLDEGREGETDDVTRIGRKLYEKRWSQYGGDPPTEFDQDGFPVEVVGTRILPRSP